jgi:3-methyladenine DNA glycosylase/8-oxoguanine DNA glycosylase
MTRLKLIATAIIEPIPPYDFGLTVSKPAGWPLFTPDEVHEGRTVWTATHIEGDLVGVKLSSRGTPNRLRVMAQLHMKENPTPGRIKHIRESVAHSIGADEDLTDFYNLAEKDEILQLAVEDLKGMHKTMQSSVFPDSCLAILLQMAPLKRSNEMMACFIRRYGEQAEYDGKMVQVWPLPTAVAKIDPEEMAQKCKVGYRANRLALLAQKIDREGFPSVASLEKMLPEEAKRRLLELPGIGDYSADIINPHGGFPIDAWTVDVFGRLFFGSEPEEKRKSIGRIKQEGLRRWGKWSWLAFLYVVQDLERLSTKLGYQLRLS